MVSEMTLTIQAGWWLLPAALTLAAFGFAFATSRPSSSPGYGDGIVGVFVYGAALIASLIAWLIWAVVR